MAFDVNSVSETIIAGAAPFDQCRQFASNPTTGERRIRERCQALARDIINDVEDAEASATGD
jgi:hypothetical protein